MLVMIKTHNQICMGLPEHQDWPVMNYMERDYYSYGNMITENDMCSQLQCIDKKNLAIDTL